MNGHLSPSVVSALADGELSPADLAAAKAHVDACLACASAAVDAWLLKSAVAAAGRRSTPSPAFHDRMERLAAGSSVPLSAGPAPVRFPRWPVLSGWVAAALLLVLTGWGLLAMRAHSRDASPLVAEACDLHIAMLAGAQPPQVISSDRHTVKPWFQGKLPFAFNLPAALPDDTHLDGANLAYLGSHPVAQLLFSIGRHRVSVFVAQKSSAGGIPDRPIARSGFQVAAFATDDLDVLAVSDVDPARLADLMSRLRAAQSTH